MSRRQNLVSIQLISIECVFGLTTPVMDQKRQNACKRLNSVYIATITPVTTSPMVAYTDAFEIRMNEAKA